MLEIQPAAKRIKWIREDQQLNQTAFADRIGVSQPTISAIELGNTQISMGVFLSVCRAFNVDPMWLGFGVGDPYLNPQRERQRMDTLNKASAAISEIIAEINRLPLDVVLMITLRPDNFLARNPDLNYPPLIALLQDPRFIHGVRPSGEELTTLAAALKALPSLYRHADRLLYLRLIESFRQSKIDDVRTLIIALEDVKSAPRGHL